MLNLDPSTMTEEQKQAYSNLMGTLVSGVTSAVGGDATAAQLASKVEVDNNQNVVMDEIYSGDYGRCLSSGGSDEFCKSNSFNKEPETYTMGVTYSKITGIGNTGSVGSYVVKPGTDDQGFPKIKQFDVGTYAATGYGVGHDSGWGVNFGKNIGDASSLRGWSDNFSTGLGFVGGSISRSNGGANHNPKLPQEYTGYSVNISIKPSVVSGSVSSTKGCTKSIMLKEGGCQ